MKTIKEARKNIALLWRAPKPSQTAYRPMKFLLQAQVDDGLLLYNVVTSEMVLLDGDEEQVFKGLPAAYHAGMDLLIAGHYAVPEGFDENRSVRQLRALVRKLEPAKRVSAFTILPTTECNARCYYCFESDHEHCTMTEKIAADTVDYIAEKCKGEPVSIGWFGGEPLVGSKRISRICEGLKEKGIRFSSTMVSNAYLFDEALIRTAKDEWKITNVQITLDGTERVYNETKAYVNPGENPYQRVLRNIDGLLANGIGVNVRLNVTDKNYADLCDLVDELADRFGGKSGFTCYSHVVYDGVGFEPLSYDDADSVDAQTIALDARLRDKKLLGTNSRLPSLKIIHCMADNDSTRLIYPDGTIGKCENMSSRDGIGNIYRDITDREKDAWYKTVEQPPKCDACRLFPSCYDLKACPEAGKCTDGRVNWKLDRYIALLRERYHRYMQEGSHEGHEEAVQVECET